MKDNPNVNNVRGGVNYWHKCTYSQKVQGDLWQKDTEGWVS